MTEDFKRNDLLFSLCGLNCSLCPMFVRKLCTGCIHNSMCSTACSIVPCSMEHGSVDYCFECGKYPCDKYEEVDQNDSIITHINQLRDMEKAKTMGINKYHQEQSQKVEILNKFIENYNYNNDNEVFFCTAINLLPLEDLISITDKLDKITENMALEDKYNCLKEKLFESANNNNIKIELRKGKYNKEKITFD